MKKKIRNCRNCKSFRVPCLTEWTRQCICVL